jgi:hypothetical protein
MKPTLRPLRQIPRTVSFRRVCPSVRCGPRHLASVRSWRCSCLLVSKVPSETLRRVYAVIAHPRPLSQMPCVVLRLIGSLLWLCESAPPRTRCCGSFINRPRSKVPSNPTYIRDRDHAGYSPAGIQHSNPHSTSIPMRVYVRREYGLYFAPPEWSRLTSPLSDERMSQRLAPSFP